MKVLFIILGFLNLQNAYSQIINSGFEDWELIDCCGEPFEDPAGWKTNNDNVPWGFANTPVTKGIDSAGFHARIESNYNGIDALLPGEMSQTISSYHLEKFHFISKCDNIFQSGRCIVKVLGDNPNTVFYVDSIAIEASQFELYSIHILSEWRQENDSLTIQFIAKGNLDFWDKEEDGHSIFLVDNVTAEYITNTEDTNADVDIGIYPNPSNGILHITNQSMNKGIIEIFSLTGQIKLRTNYSENLDLSSLSNGAYIFRLVTNKSQFNKMFIIEK